MKPAEDYCNRALELGIGGAKVISPRSVVTAEWVMMKCQFGCHRYGKSHSCPPRTPTPVLTRRVIDSYEKAILLHRRLSGGERSKGFNEAVVRLESEIFFDGYYKVWSMGQGPCQLCKECDLNEPCRHGNQARPSMEACGIDVFTTARENGFPIEVVRTRDEDWNIYGLVLVE